MYMCTLFTSRYICILSLQYIWILPGSPGVSSQHPGSYPSTPHAVCVRVHAHTHKTHYTSTPCKKWGDTSLAQTNPSFYKQDQLGKPRSPLFYIRMQWCFKHLWIALKTPVSINTQREDDHHKMDQNDDWDDKHDDNGAQKKWCKRRWSHRKITRAFIWRLTEHNMSYMALYDIKYYIFSYPSYYVS